MTGDRWSRIRGNEIRDHRRILGFRVLPRAKDIEIPEGNCLETVHFRKNPEIVLPGQFRDRIRGEGRRGHIFALGKCGSIAVHR